MTLNTLLLLQGLLHSQQVNVGADDDQIQAVLTAKAELAKAITEAQSEASA